MRALAVAATVFALSGCGGRGHAPDAGRHAAPAHAPAVAPHVGGAPEDPEAPSVWSAPPTPLADELAHAETAAACAARVRGSVTPDVAEVLADIGYGALAEDTCGALAAVRDGDARACDTLSISAVRRGCRRRVALVRAQPDACPEDPSLDGREPVCVAWATRRPSLCRAASAGDVGRCEAVLANDPARCAAAPAPRDCRAEVRRYGSVLALTTPERGAGDGVTPAFTVTLRYSDRTLTVDHAVAVARGALVVLCSGARRVTLGPLSRTDTEPPLFVDAPAPWVTLARRDDDGHGPPRIPLGAPGSDARLVVALPHHPGLTSDTGARATVTLTALDAVRGGRVAGTLEGTLRADGEDVHVEGRFDTFVRDVREGGNACGL